MRLVASDAQGTLVQSTEVTVTVAGPAAPGAPILHEAVLSGSLVSLSWAAGAGSPPSHYVIGAAYHPAGPLVAAFPVTGSSVTVNAPAGTYYVTIAGVNGLGAGPASNQIRVIVP